MLLHRLRFRKQRPPPGQDLLGSLGDAVPQFAGARPNGCRGSATFGAEPGRRHMYYAQPMGSARPARLVGMGLGRLDEHALPPGRQEGGAMGCGKRETEHPDPQDDSRGFGLASCNGLECNGLRDCHMVLQYHFQPDTPGAMCRIRFLFVINQQISAPRHRPALKKSQLGYAFDAAIRVAGCASLLTGYGRRARDGGSEFVGRLAPATEVGDEVLARPDGAAGRTGGFDLTGSPYAPSHGSDR